MRGPGPAPRQALVILLLLARSGGVRGPGPAPRQALVILLLLALLAAPWLGLVHAVLHLRSSPVDRAVAAVVQKAAQARAAARQAGTAADGDGCAVEADSLRRLFGSHGHDGDCQLYDQLAHGDGLSRMAAPPPGVLPPPAALIAWRTGEYLRRWAALYDARGPPFPA